MTNQQLVLRVLCAFAILAASSAAHADPIYVTISTVASGTFGTQAFTNQLVTVTGSFSAQDIAEFETTESQYFPPNTYSFDSGSDLDVNVTVNVAGIGTGVGFGQYGITIAPGELAITDDIGNLELFVDSPLLNNANPFQSIGPIMGSTYQTNLGNQCALPEGWCPIGMNTYAGSLILTSASDTATGEIQVGAPSPTPEPSTLCLLMTGVTALLGLNHYKRSK